MNLRISMGPVSVVALAVAAGMMGGSACAGYPSCDDYGRDCGGGTAGTGGDVTSGASGMSGDAGGGAVGGGGGGNQGGKGGGGKGGGGQGGTDASGAGAGGGGPACDSTKSPSEEGCLVSDEFAIFVSPDGDDDANHGTQSAPLASLTKAVEVAAGEKLVLVCNATYDEHVVIATGVRVYGGFKCSDWSTEDDKPIFKPTTSGVALLIDDVSDDVLVEGVSFEVGDADDAGETALTAIVNQSPKVTFRSVSLKAGKGKTGDDGSLTNFTFPSADTLNGNAESPAGSGGAGKKCECQPTLSSTGGVGGTPIDGGQNGSKGQPDHGGGLGGDPAAGDCGAGSAGKKGGNAQAAGTADGAKVLGDGTIAGWKPASGTDGATGSPGQGGGGGASLNASGHGGGGGCGGCGGNGGTAGKGGGGSIALLALNSPVTLVSSVLTTGDAGDGGDGVAGQAGQEEVGNGGNSVASTNSCGGGSGGKGGDGGAGGGGAGGVSVGIVWKGAMQPAASADTTFTMGKAGAKGIGGVPGTNDGVAGVAQKILKVQ